MKECFAQLCGLAILCGLVLRLTPDGSVRRVLSFCGTVLLILTLLQTIQDLDYSSYCLELARYRDMGRTLSEDAESVKDRLSRQVVEEEYKEYIRGRAEALGVTEPAIEIELRWDTEGFWEPERVVLRGRTDEEKKERLNAVLEAELGLPAEALEWINDEA